MEPQCGRISSKVSQSRRVAESVVSSSGTLVPSMENCWAMWNFGSFNQLYLLVGMAESDVQT